MKKRILGALILLLAVATYFVATLYFSAKSASTAEEWSQKLAESAPYLKVSSDYRRGLFSSTQLVTVELPAAPGKAQSLTFKNVIKHGPFPGFSNLGMAQIEHSWEFDEATQKELAVAFGSAQPFAATTTIGIDGSGITELRGAPANYKSGEDTITWQGLTGTVRFSRDMASYSGEISAPLLSVAGKKGGADFKGFVIKMDQRRMTNTEALYLGNMSASIEALSFKDGKDEGRLEKLAFVGEATSTDNQFMDIKMSFRAGKVAGADVDASDVDYTLSVRHLHAASLDGWIKAVRAASPKAGAGKAGAPPDPAAAMAQIAAMEAAMKTHGLAMLKNDPVIAIDRITLKMNGGELKMSGTARVPGVTDADVQQPLNLIAKVDAAATIAVTEVLARNQYAQAKVRTAKKQLGELTEAQTAEIAAGAGSEFAQMLTMFGQQGYFVSEGGMLNSKVAFKGGMLTVNDQPFKPAGAAPPPEMPSTPPPAGMKR